MKRSLYIYISIINALLIVLWGYAALSKLTDFSVFERQLERQPVPGWSIELLKWGLPIIELFTVILLYIEKTRFKGFMLSLCLLILFTVYVIVALSGAFGQIPCSCAGIISKLSWKQHLVFNLSFIAINFLGIYLYKRQDEDLLRHSMPIV